MSKIIKKIIDDFNTLFADERMKEAIMYAGNGIYYYPTEIEG